MSDTYDTEAATAAVAAHLVEQDEVGELVADLNDAAGSALNALSALPSKSPAIVTLMQQLRRISRMVDAEGDRIIQEARESREEGRAWERELARENRA